eukprot:UN23230
MYVTFDQSSEKWIAEKSLKGGETYYGGPHEDEHQALAGLCKSLSYDDYDLTDTTARSVVQKPSLAELELTKPPLVKLPKSKKAMEQDSSDDETDKLPKSKKAMEQESSDDETDKLPKSKQAMTQDSSDE